VRGALRLAGGTALALLATLAFTPLPNLLYRRLDSPPAVEPAQAIVVLGAGVDEGVLGDDSLRRTVGGVALFRRGLAPLIVMLGPGRRGEPSEAEVRARVVADMGVPAAAVIADPRGHTTREEALVCWEVLAPRGARRILLVTGAQHMPRATGLFRRAGFVVVPGPVDELPARATRPEGRLKLSRGLLRELVAWVYNRAAGYL
jgi:uncharacterized SAM-binding protein YcdF (DUF218 family)